MEEFGEGNDEMREIDIFQGSKHYEKFLRSFYTVDTKSKKVKFDFKSNRISKAIFYHLWKVYHSEWEMRVGFKLMRKHTLSDYFRDLVACYLNLFLDDQFETVLESGKEHPTKKTKRGGKKIIVPDILIKKKGKPMFAIEIKTTIGWDREMKEFEARVEDIYATFEIPKKNIIYIFNSAKNVNKNFEGRYWDAKINKPKRQYPKDLPYSKIYPLFYETPDSYYWEETKYWGKLNEVKRGEQIKEFTKGEVLRKAEENIIWKFEDIIMQIEIAGW